MNAYDLSTELLMASSEMEYNHIVNDWKLLSDSANMLRQQADEIKLLRQGMKDGFDGLETMTALSKAQADTIAEFEKEKGLSRNSPSPMNQAYLTRYEEDYKPYGYVWTSLKDCMETRFTRSYPLEFYKPFDIVPVYTTPQDQADRIAELEKEVDELWDYKISYENLDSGKN